MNSDLLRARSTIFSMLGFTNGPAGTPGTHDKFIWCAFKWTPDPHITHCVRSTFQTPLNKLLVFDGPTVRILPKTSVLVLFHHLTIGNRKRAYAPTRNKTTRSPGRDVP